MVSRATSLSTVAMSCEANDAGDSSHEAVHGEGPQCLGLEEADEKPDRAVGGDAGEEGAHESLAAYTVAEVAEEVRDLVEPSGGDDRRGEQEREAGGVFVVHTASEPGDHGDARPADPGEQRGGRRNADDARFFEVESVEAPSRLGVRWLRVGVDGLTRRDPAT